VIHYVYDQTAGTVSGYINGVFQTSVTVGASYPLDGNNFVVGSQGTSIDGTMDEFRMYNRALSAGEISSTWNLPLPLTQCSGAVTAGSASATVTNACGAVPFSILLTGSTNAGGITYQWQSSPAGANTFTDINGATGSAYTVANQTVATDYRCVVTCTNSNSTQTSTVVSVGQNPFNQCYCTPVYTTGCATYNLNSFVLTGENGTNINDLNTGCSSNTTDKGYDDRRSLFTPVDLIQEGTYPIEINTTSTSALVRASIWIDFNDNGAFDASEKLLTDVALATNPAFASASIDIPASADPGIHRMRVRAVYSTTGLDACASVASGETHDYDVNILATNCYKPLDIQESDVTKNS